MSVESHQGTVAVGGSGLRLPAAVARELWRDRFFHLAIVAYVLAAAGLALALGKPGNLVAFAYAPLFLRGGLTIGALVVVLIEVPRAIRAAPTRPLPQLVTQLKARITPRLVAGALLFLGVSLYYGAFTGIKAMLPDLAPFNRDVWAADLDAALHGGHDPWRLLQPLLGHHLITRAIQVCYLPAWTTALCVLTALVAVSQRLEPLRARFFGTYLLAWPLLGNVVAAAGMSGGPVYYGRLTGDADRFAPLLAYLDFSRGLPLSSVDLQQALWAGYVSGAAGLGSGISAFPSLHVAMVTLFVLATWRIHKALSVGFMVFGAIILAGSVHLGWHYAIDGYFSAVTVAALWFGLGRLLRAGVDTKGDAR